MSQIYFNYSKLEAVRTSGVQSGETLLGFVFTPGFDSGGKPVIFPFLRVRDSRGNIVVKEITDVTKAGCPYPPPCDTMMLGDCYSEE